MNKSLLVLLAIGSSAYAAGNASPIVGDSATYIFTTTTAGTAVTGEVTATIATVDATADAISINMSVTVGGQAEDQAPTSLKLSDYQNMFLFSTNCASFEDPSAGQSAKVEQITVKAGTFTACHFKTATDDIYYADVPGGYVKETTKAADGSSIMLELSSSHRNPAPVSDPSH